MQALEPMPVDQRQVTTAPALPANDPILRVLDQRRLNRYEWIMFIVLFAAILALRLVYIYHNPFDSDEPQHLHVAWGWTKGMVQYRDYFDNHVPLFHMLTAPIVSLIGERPDILILMRLVMLPLFAGVMWASYGIIRALISQRAGLWAAVFVGFFPCLFLCSLEFRTDNLWVMVWMFALYVLLSGKLSWKRCLLGGFVLGLAFSVSLKTVLMFVSLGSAVLMLPLVSQEFRQSFSWRKALQYGGAFLAGMLVMPFIIATLFYALGAWKEFVYCTITHSIVPAKAAEHAHWPRSQILRTIVFLLLFAGWGWWLSHKKALAGRGTKAALLILTTSNFALLLETFWPVGQIQTFIPFYPIFVLSMVVLPFTFQFKLQRASRFNGALLSKFAPLIAILLVGYEIYLLTSSASVFRNDDRFNNYDLLAIVHKPFRNDTLSYSDLLAAVLKLTKPSDYLLDPKGETVFRNRPFYYGLEKFTQERLARGLIPNTIAQRCIETQTCVIYNTLNRFPKETIHFLDQVYFDVGHNLSVAGQFIKVNGPVKGKTLKFNVVIPARYAMITNKESASGKLDGADYHGPLALSAGQHEFIPDREEDVAYIWAQAVERGFYPHTQKDEKHSPIQDNPSPGHRHHHKPPKVKKGFFTFIGLTLFKVTH